MTHAERVKAIVGDSWYTGVVRAELEKVLVAVERETLERAAQLCEDADQAWDGRAIASTIRQSIQVNAKPDEAGGADRNQTAVEKSAGQLPAQDGGLGGEGLSPNSQPAVISSKDRCAGCFAPKDVSLALCDSCWANPPSESAKKLKELEMTSRRPSSPDVTQTARQRTKTTGAGYPLSEEAIAFEAMCFPCKPPCDSYSACLGCADSGVYRSGYHHGWKARGDTAPTAEQVCDACREAWAKHHITAAKCPHVSPAVTAKGDFTVWLVESTTLTKDGPMYWGHPETGRWNANAGEAVHFHDERSARTVMRLCGLNGEAVPMQHEFVSQTRPGGQKDG